MAQIVASVIFITMFVLIVLEVFDRHIVTLLSGAAVILFVFGLCMHSPQAIWRTLNLGGFAQSSFWYGESSETSSGINWSTIVFILGMMIMVEGMGMSGFFRWLCLRIAKAVHYKKTALLVCFMIMSGILAMFIDSITVILFLAAVTAELGRTLGFNPVPMIISEIFCANLGGAATMCGDPPNIIVGTSLGLTFFDFLSNTGVIVAICLVFTVLYFYLCFRKKLGEEGEPPKNLESPRSAITNVRAFTVSVVIFLCVVVLLITHAQTTLTVATIGVIASVLTFAGTVFTFGKKGISYIIKHIDYKTLLFFTGLFVAVGGLEETGVLELIASFIEKVSGGSTAIIVVIVLWLSAVASAFVDNIPFAATMVPVVELMSQRGADLHVLAWALSLGTDLGGNATPIGASANVVGTSVAAKEGHPISWGTYCKYCVPATLMVVTVSMLCIFVKYIF